MKKSEWVKHLKECKEDHGGPQNGAYVYGHVGKLNRRVCIRVKSTDVWVFDPRWEK